MKSSLYLFLDVDGVLHPAGPGVREITRERSGAGLPGKHKVPVVLRGLWAENEDPPPFNCLPILAAAVRPYLDRLAIVISSSWRTEPELYDAVLATMDPDMRARVAGATPRGNSRPTEINKWLHEHAASTAMAIVLDDYDTDEWCRLTRRAILLLTVPKHGFTDKDGQCLSRLLSIDRKTFKTLRTALPMGCHAEELVKALENVE